MMTLPKTPQTVLVTGANGCISNAFAKTFVNAWTTYSLVREKRSITPLAADGIIPVLGSAADLSFPGGLYGQTKTFHVIVSATEQIMDYVPHFNDTVALLRHLAKTSNEAGVRPLIMFKSGCKDYGTTGLARSLDLAPHTEPLSLNPPAFAVDRARHATKIFDHSDLFDVFVLRPATVCGLSSSFYGPLFNIADKAVEKGVLELTANPRTHHARYARQ